MSSYYESEGRAFKSLRDHQQQQHLRPFFGMAVLVFDSRVTLRGQFLRESNTSLDSVDPLGSLPRPASIWKRPFRGGLADLLAVGKPWSQKAEKGHLGLSGVIGSPLIEITKFPRLASPSSARKVGSCFDWCAPQTCGSAGEEEANVFDPEGGKFRVAHDCGASGLSRRADLIWAAPKKGTRSGHAPKAATPSGVKP